MLQQMKEETALQQEDKIKFNSMKQPQTGCQASDLRLFEFAF